MNVQTWTYVIVGITFSIYIGIAILSRVRSTKDFYVAGGGVGAWANGMATAADWMSAASFISMAGVISFAGYDGAVFLMPFHILMPHGSLLMSHVSCHVWDT